MNQHRRMEWWGAALVPCLTALLAANVAADNSILQRHSYLGVKPPELVSDKEHWIGPSEPLTLAKLKGKVVWLHFNF